MEREIGRWNKATGIKKYVAGQVQGVDEPVELWVGDVIECRVYITDRAGCYIRITGKVLWDVAYGMYIIHGHFVEAAGSFSNFFPLHKIVNENIKFITKVPRFFGSQRDIIFHIVKEMREYQHGPDDGDMMEAMDAMVNRICDMGVIPKEEIMAVFNGE